jgi:hypothetical protein
VAFNRRPLDPPKTIIGADKGAKEYFGNLHEDLVALVPVGGMVGWTAALAVPDGWLRTDGAQVSRQDYKRLYSIVGDTYGSGTATTFTLPTRADTIIKF